MGVVSRADDLSLDRQVALIVLPSHLPGGPRATARPRCTGESFPHIGDLNPAGMPNRRNPVPRGLVAFPGGP